MILAISRNKDPKSAPPYQSLYQFTQPPFSSAGTFFADPERAKALDMLQHLTQYSEEMLLLTGPEGVGKSSLLEQFLQRREEHWRVCRLDASESIGAEVLFQRIAECFQLDLSSIAQEDLLQGLQSQLSLLQEQQLPVLLVDDVQRLSDDALELVMHLATLEGEHGKLVRVVLAGDESIDAHLATERFASMPPPHRLELKALDESQTAAYLAHSLAQAGYGGPQLFSEKEVRQIHRQSRGLPGGINDEAHELLMQRVAPKRAGVAKSAGTYLKMGVAATAIVGSVLGLHERINALLGGEERVLTVSSPERPVMRTADQGSPWAVVIRDGERIQISCGAPAGDTVAVRPVMNATAMVQQPMPLTAPMLEDVSPAPSEDKAAVEETPGSESPSPAAGKAPEIQSMAEAPTPAKVQEKPAETVAAAETTEKKATEAAAAELKLTGFSPDPLIGSDQPGPIVINGSGFVEGSKVAVSRPGKVEVLPADKVQVLDANRIIIEVNTGTKPAAWAVQVSTPDNRRSNVLRFKVQAPPEAAPPASEAPAKTAAEKPKPVMQAGESAAAAVPSSTGKSFLGSDWLSRQPAQNYTLQLMASGSAQSLTRFAAENKLSGPLAMFTMDKGGKALHVLTLGSYASRGEAERAAKSLPRGLHPWIRSLQSVQQVMRHEIKPRAEASVSFPPAGAGIKDTAWVWSQDPGRYTIQLAAAESEQAIEAAMRRIALPGELVVVQTQRDGRPWYALIYGSFSSRDAARGTIERLPASLREAGPWPRSFASLHDEISRSTPPN